MKKINNIVSMYLVKEWGKLMKSFLTAPFVMTKRRTKRTSGKYGSISPVLNDPHDTKAISGFKGQPGGKVKTLKTLYL